MLASSMQELDIQTLRNALSPQLIPLHTQPHFPKRLEKYNDNNILWWQTKEELDPFSFRRISTLLIQQN